MAGAPGWNEVVWPEADEVDLAAASAALPAAGSYIVRFVLMGKAEGGSLGLPKWKLERLQNSASNI